jgi:hypothetical protein
VFAKDLFNCDSEIEVCNGLAMNYHVTVFFKIDEMIIPKEDAPQLITKRLDMLEVYLDEDISDPIAIMCIHGRKQWSGHAKIHFKNILEDGIFLFQGLRPFIAQRKSL